MICAFYESIFIFYIKIMTNSELIKKVQSAFLQDGREQIRTGMEVEVYQIIREWGKERVQRYKGLVIKVAGKHELEKTITVRRKVGAFGVEKVFAIHSSTIEKIDIIRQFKVRRKSIKFIRDLNGKAARLKEVKKDVVKTKAAPKKAVKAEAPVEEKKKEAPKKDEAKETKAKKAPVEKKEVAEKKEEK